MEKRLPELNNNVASANYFNRYTVKTERDS